MDDPLTTLCVHYHVPFADWRLGNIIERDRQRLIKELVPLQKVHKVMRYVCLKNSIPCFTICVLVAIRRIDVWI